MPDITMCPKTHGKDKKENLCPLRQKCYRYTATPYTKNQGWFKQPPFLKEDPAKGFISCQYHWV